MLSLFQGHKGSENRERCCSTIACPRFQHEQFKHAWQDGLKVILGIKLNNCQQKTSKVTRTSCFMVVGVEFNVCAICSSFSILAPSLFISSSENMASHSPRTPSGRRSSCVSNEEHAFRTCGVALDDKMVPRDDIVCAGVNLKVYE